MNQSVAKAAKHTGINVLLYVAICAIIAVGYIAWDTDFFTKQPSWWQARQSLGYATSRN